MKAGVIGVPSEDFSQLESYTNSYTQEGYELEECLEIRRTANNEINGRPIQTGRVALQRVEDTESVEIKDGEIVVSERPEIVTRYTEFVTVPGKFVAVSNSSGVFAFDVLGRQTNTNIEKVEFDLDTFAQQQNNGVPWKVGFYGRIGNAENGVLYGDDVLDDNEFGGVVKDTEKNQLGLNLPMGDEIIKLNLTESGYVEIYQPSNYDEIDFSEFVISKLLDYSQTPA